MKIKLVVHRMLSMCPEAWYIFIRSIQLCCVLLLCSFMLLLQWGGSLMENYRMYSMAMSMQEITQVLLIIAFIVPACIEDAHT